MEAKDVTLFRQARDAAKNRLSEVEEQCNALENEKLSLQATVTSLDELLNEGEPIYGTALAEALQAMQAVVQAGADRLTETGRMFAEATLDPLAGLTESCRQLLEILPNTGVQVTEVVKMLEEKGFDFHRYNNRVSAVHTVFTRFCKSGEAKIIARTPGGRQLYATNING